MELKEKNLNPETEVEYRKKKRTKWRRKKKTSQRTFFQRLEKNFNGHIFLTVRKKSQPRDRGRAKQRDG